MGKQKVREASREEDQVESKWWEAWSGTNLV